MEELTVYNIYNDCNNNNTIHQVIAFNHSQESGIRQNMASAKHVIWLGDFNRHHPHWDNPTDTRLFTSAAMRNAKILINAVAEAGLDLALPQGIPTHVHNVSKKWTRLDQVFISEDGRCHHMRRLKRPARHKYRPPANTHIHRPQPCTHPTFSSQ
jgi:endonuclease/exonuclease/phosphatase family metal-dependent hydrolase